jgi:sarcosine oxidase
VKEKFDVIVLGVGTMGAATCYALARRGMKVLGLEQFEIVHTRGSHSAHTRLIRQSYFEHEDYVPLLQEAHKLWKVLEAESGRKMYHEEGLLYCGEVTGDMLSGVRKSSLKHKIQLDDVSAAAWLKQLNFHPEYAALWEPVAGYLDVEQAILGFVDMATKNGATIYQHQEVKGWNVEEDLVSVTTAADTYQADKLVITAGAWSTDLLQGIVPMSVTKQNVAWFSPDDPDFMLPCWCIDHPSGKGIYYGFPKDQFGFKIGHHHPGSSIEPEVLDSEVSDADINELRSVLEHLKPGTKFSLTNTSTCLYSMTQDGHFTLDIVPDTHERICFAAGFSGHGFKFAPVVGEVLADLSLKGATLRPIDFLKVARFD